MTLLTLMVKMLLLCLGNDIKSCNDARSCDDMKSLFTYCKGLIMDNKFKDTKSQKVFEVLSTLKNYTQDTAPFDKLILMLFLLLLPLVVYRLSIGRKLF